MVVQLSLGDFSDVNLRPNVCPYVTHVDVVDFVTRNCCFLQISWKLEYTAGLTDSLITDPTQSIGKLKTTQNGRRIEQRQLNV
jgi:hypothetical protein